MNKIIKDSLRELIGKDRLIELMGLILLILVALSQITFLFKVLGIIVGLMINNYARLKINTKGNMRLPVKLEDLRSPATYVIVENPYVSVYNPKSFFQYFMLAECITGHNERWSIIVEIPEDKNNRYKLQVALGKYLEKIKTGEGFKVDKDHNITKIET